MPDAPAPTLWQRLLAVWRRPRSAQTVVLVLATWITLAANVQLWRVLLHADALPAGVAACLRLGVVVFCANALMLSLFGWSRWAKPLWLAFTLAAAICQHYMLTYGVVIDGAMLANIGQTNRSEMADLLTWALLGNVLFVMLLPVLWIVPLPIVRAPWWRSVRRAAIFSSLLVAATLALTFASYRSLAPLVRNNMQLRFLPNPAMPLVAASKVVSDLLFKPSKTLVRSSAGAGLGPSHAAALARVPLVVLVIGETARADHFSLNGYERPTNPDLAGRGVYSYGNTWSCGTYTLASLPCMFSPLGKDGFARRRSEHENLLDVAAAAGLAVLWLDNQAGCKGVCARVPTASTEDLAGTPAGKALCEGDECLDEALLAGLDERIAALPAERRRNGVLLVMHMMGSHGPAYSRRSPAAVKRFLPECLNNVLGECERSTLINAYDNSIAYTDRVLARTIDWLKLQSAGHDTAMLYVSDHGESLGEYGVFLHGLPYAFAPDTQKHVPMVLWLGASMAERDGIEPGCLRSGLGARLSHDNLYHSVLGLVDVATPTYQSQLDVIAACRKGHGSGDARNAPRPPGAA